MIYLKVSDYYYFLDESGELNYCPSDIATGGPKLLDAEVVDPFNEPFAGSGEIDKEIVRVLEMLKAISAKIDIAQKAQG